VVQGAGEPAQVSVQAVVAQAAFPVVVELARVDLVPAEPDQRVRPEVFGKAAGEVPARVALQGLALPVADRVAVAELAQAARAVAQARVLALVDLAQAALAQAQPAAVVSAAGPELAQAARAVAQARVLALVDLAQAALVQAEPAAVVSAAGPELAAPVLAEVVGLA
jgi:hypothetical protein